MEPLLRIIVFLYLLVSAIFAQELTPVSLQLAWKYQFQFAGYIMAKEKGFYADEGLDVALREYENGLDPHVEVSKKRVDFAIGRAGVIQDIIDKDAPFLLLLALTQAEPVILETIKRDDIKSIQDLKGKTFIFSGHPDYNSINPSIASMLHSAGLKLSDFTYKPTKTYDPVEITNGYGDFIIGYSTITPYQLEKMGFEPVTFDPKDYGFDFYGDILFTHQALFDENPKLVDAFYKASIKGWEYAFSNIEETINVISEKYNTQNLSKDVLRFEANAFKKLAFSPSIPFGDINPVKIGEIINAFRLLGISKSTTLDHSSFIYEPPSKDSIRFTSEQKSYINSCPTIRIGIPPNFYPFDIDKTKGFYHDVLQLLSQKTGLHVEKVYADTATLLEKLKSNSIDGVMGVYDGHRVSDVYYSQSFFSTKETLFTKKSTKESEIHSLGSVSFDPQNRARKIENIKIKYPDASTLSFDSIDMALEALGSKKIDALFVPKSSVVYALQNQKIDGLRLVQPTQSLKDKSLHILTGNKILNDILNLGIKQINDASGFESLANKWIPVWIEKNFDWELFYQVLAGIFLAFILLFYRYISILKLNQKLTLQEKALIKAHKNLEEQARVDPLTQLNNRRHFSLLAKQALALAQRQNLPISALMLDADDFKKVNDTYGHDAGDKVLQEIAKRLGDKQRESDILARFGGEEFVFLLTNTDICGAKVFAEKIRKSILYPLFEISPEISIEITVSIGISALDIGKNNGIESVYKKADEALYKAKGCGKNCIVVN